jgi:5-methylcytosine-specific restriction endonuclease McrA
MSVTLVLNATYEPLCVVPLRRAVVLVLAEKATVVETGAGMLRSERQALAVPSVVRLSRYVRVPYRHAVPLTRRAVLERDGHRCAYCARRAETVDHVVPRSRGGGHGWHNVVAACSRCNHRKGNRLLPEIGWSLDWTPAPPPATVALLVGLSRREPAWEPYLGLRLHAGL